MRRVTLFSESSESELIQMFQSMIDTTYENKEFEKMKSFQHRLKQKFGIDYNPSSKDKNVVSLSNVLSVQDFSSFSKYVNYCHEIFSLRFKKYKGLYTNRYENIPVRTSNIVATLNSNGYSVSEEYRRNDTFIAFVVGKKIIINTAHEEFVRDTILLDILIHELAHVFENESGLNLKNDYSHNMAYSSSNYIHNPAETFAENFKNFFLEPRYLKGGWKEVYVELNNEINAKWKNMVYSLIEGSVR